MKILIVSDTYKPASNSAAQMLEDLAKEFSRQGHKIAVLTASPDIECSMSIRTEEGVDVVRVHTTSDIKAAGRARRALAEMQLSGTYWTASKEYLKLNHFDLVILYSPTIFLAPLVRRIRGMWGSKVYLVLRDIFPDWALDAGILNKGIVFRYFRHRAKQQFAIADRIGVETKSTIEYFSRRYSKWASKVEMLTNWMRMTNADQIDEHFRAHHGLENKVIFAYGGNLGVAQDMDNLLRLAQNLKAYREAHFLLIGRGSEVPKIEQHLANGEMANITLLPPLAEDAYIALLRTCDVGIINLDRRLQTRNIPGKLLGYIKAGLPVLASLNPANDLGETLDRAGVGLWSVNGDDSSFSANAIRLASDAKLREAMAKNGQKLYREMFSVEHAVHQILSMQQR